MLTGSSSTVTSIEAIKVYRVVHRVGLKEAKDAVEQRQRTIGLR